MKIFTRHGAFEVWKIWDEGRFIAISGVLKVILDRATYLEGQAMAYLKHKELDNDEAMKLIKHEAYIDTEWDILLMRFIKDIKIVTPCHAWRLNLKGEVERLDPNELLRTSNHT